MPGFVYTNNYNESKDSLGMSPLLKRFRNVSVWRVTFNADSFTSWFFFHKTEILKLNF